MEFVEVIRKTAEKMDEYQEVAAIRILHYSLAGLVSVPDNWDEEVRPLVLKEIGELIETAMEEDDIIIWKRQYKEDNHDRGKR